MAIRFQNTIAEYDRTTYYKIVIMQTYSIQR